MIKQGTNSVPGRQKAPGKNCARQEKNTVENRKRVDETRNKKVSVTGYCLLIIYRHCKAKERVSGANLEEPEVLINIVNFWFCLTDLLVALVQYVIKTL